LLLAMQRFWWSCAAQLLVEDAMFWSTLEYCWNFA